MMRISDDALKCVVFLCSEEKKRGRMSYRAEGSAFFMSVKSGEHGALYTYLVTAKHVIPDIQKDRSGIKARINTKAGRSEYVDVSSGWELSPTSDAAVLPFCPSTKLDYHVLVPEFPLTDEMVRAKWIGIGDNLFTVGLFTKRVGEERNLPLVRSGIIAAMPDEPVRDNHQGNYPSYLAEMRSIGGLSGSPVFVYLEPHRIVPPEHDEALKTWLEIHKEEFARTPPPLTEIRLLGIVRGTWTLTGSGRMLRFGERELLALNSGIALVTPIQDATRLLMSEKVMGKLCKLDEDITKDKLTIADSRPKGK